MSDSKTAKKIVEVLPCMIHPGMFAVVVDGKTLIDEPFTGCGTEAEAQAKAAELLKEFEVGSQALPAAVSGKLDRDKTDAELENRTWIQRNTDETATISAAAQPTETRPPRACVHNILLADECATCVKELPRHFQGVWRCVRYNCGCPCWKPNGQSCDWCKSHNCDCVDTTMWLQLSARAAAPVEPPKCPWCGKGDDVTSTHGDGICAPVEEVPMSAFEQGYAKGYGDCLKKLPTTELVEPAPRPQINATTKCRCGRMIIWLGTYWWHESDRKMKCSDGVFAEPAASSPVARPQCPTCKSEIRPAGNSFCQDNFHEPAARVEQPTPQFDRICEEHDCLLNYDGTCPYCRDAQGKPFILDMQSYHLKRRAAAPVVEQREEDFWMKACIHLIFCNGKECGRCHRIKQDVELNRRTEGEGQPTVPQQVK